MKNPITFIGICIFLSALLVCATLVLTHNRYESYNEKPNIYIFDKQTGKGYIFNTSNNKFTKYDAIKQTSSSN